MEKQIKRPRSKVAASRRHSHASQDEELGHFERFSRKKEADEKLRQDQATVVHAIAQLFSAKDQDLPPGGSGNFFPGGFMPPLVHMEFKVVSYC